MDKSMEIDRLGSRDEAGSRIGMWLFLITETFLFVGPLLLYAAYRYQYAQDFVIASAGLNMHLAAMNTAVLLTSSLTITLSVLDNRNGNRGRAVILLALTAMLGFIFLSNKYVEWSVDIAHGVYPDSPELLMRPRGEVLFYGLYFFMTGLHGLHVIGGIVLVVSLLVMMISGKTHRADTMYLENTALYWHMVDIVWIYLFPLFYLIR